jgi:hypothetical protein
MSEPWTRSTKKFGTLRKVFAARHEFKLHTFRFVKEGAR